MLARVSFPLVVSVLIVQLGLPTQIFAVDSPGRQLPIHEARRFAAASARRSLLPHDYRPDYLRPNGRGKPARQIRHELWKKVPKAMLSGVGESANTVLLILATVTAKRWQEIQREKRIRELAGGLSQSKKETRKYQRLYSLADWENHGVKVPLGMAGEFYLGASDQAWVRFDGAPQGWAHVQVLSQGRMVSVEKIVRSNGRDEVPIDPLFHLLENPDSVESAGTSQTPVANVCNDPKYLGRCVEVEEYKDTLSELAGYVVNPDLIASIGGTFTGEMGRTVWNGLHAVERGAATASGRAVLQRLLSGFGHMALTFAIFWEFPGKCTEMARALMDPDDYRASENLIARFFTDLKRRDEFRKTHRLDHPAAKRIDQALTKEVQKDQRLFGLLVQNMWLILMVNGEYRDRLFHSWMRERILTADFAVIVGAIMLALQVKNVSFSLSLRAIQAMARSGQLAKRLQSVVKSSGSLIEKNAATAVLRRAGITRVAAVLGKSALWLARGAAIITAGGIIFTAVMLAVDLAPPEYKDLGTALVKNAAIDSNILWLRQNREFLIQELQRPSNPGTLASILKARSNVRQGIVNQINVMRNRLIQRIQKDESEIDILVRGAPRNLIIADLHPPSRFGFTSAPSDTHARKNEAHEFIEHADRMTAMLKPTLFAYDRKLLNIYEDEIQLFARTLGIDVGDSYDIERLIQRATSSPLRKYFVALVMMRNYIADTLQFAPERGWEGDLKRPAGEDVAEKYFEPRGHPAALNAQLDIQELQDQPERLKEAEGAFEQIAQAIDGEEAERNHIGVFGWVEWEVVRDLTCAARKDGVAQFSIFPDDTDEAAWLHVMN
jgi:hypothetical protein